jgi:hypothetical protein
MWTNKGNAHVKIRIDGSGMGEVIVNGIHMGNVVRGTSVFARVGEVTIVRLELLADRVEMESNGEVKTVIDWLEPERSIAHDFRILGDVPADKDTCRVCKQVRRVAQPECPGPLNSTQIRMT